MTTHETVTGAPEWTDALGTKDARTMAFHFHFLAMFGLDPEGAGEAFAMLHGHGPDYDAYRQFPAYAYDAKADTWHEWENVGKGWKAKRNILREMSRVVGALCALEAFRTTSGSDAAEREYPKLRRRHIGPTTEKAMKYAQALLTVEEWDVNDAMVGLPDGEALDGHVLVDQQLEDYVTKTMGAGPYGRSTEWESFLDDTTGHDSELKDALQVWLASALHPGNQHHKAHLMVGDGGTGKSTLLRTVVAAMGDYAGSARAAVFTSEKDSHPAELLPFVDKRIVVLPELPVGALRSDLLKTVTGGDSISVRGMRQNPRTERTNAAIWFTANELPSLRVVDESIRRRLMVWPLNHHASNPDVTLATRLASPQHLGAVVEWLREGLERYSEIAAEGRPMPIPKAVASATEDYLEEADVIGRWIAESLQEGMETQMSVLYGSFVKWCEAQHRRPQSERTVSTYLSRRYTRRHVRKGSVYPLYPIVKV